MLLAGLPPAHIGRMDAAVLGLGRRISRPGLGLVRPTEYADGARTMWLIETTRV